MSDWGSADGREDLSARGVRIRATAMLRRMYSYGPREGIEVGHLPFGWHIA